MNTMRTPERRQGFTLLETVVALLILSLVFGGAMTVVFQSALSFDEQIQEFSLDQFGWRVIDRLSEELAGADPPTMLPAVIASSSSLQFKTATGYDTGTASVLYGPMVTFSVQLAPGEAANGLDDNGDGRADEGFLTRQVGAGTPIQLSGNVLGLRFTSTPTGISFAVDIGLKSRDGVVKQKTFTREVTFRNN